MWISVVAFTNRLFKTQPQRAVHRHTNTVDKNSLEYTLIAFKNVKNRMLKVLKITLMHCSIHIMPLTLVCGVE